MIHHVSSLLLQKLEKEAYDLMEIATTGKFLDPAHNPTHILIDMKRVSFTKVRSAA